MNELIKSKSEWYPIYWIPSTNSSTWKEFVKQHGVGGKIPGCYQTALTKDIEDIGDNIVHEAIGYNGKAKDVIGRTGGIRAPKGRHGVRRYIDSNDLCREKDVVIRYLITENEDTSTELENSLHKEFENQFGFRFAWKTASGGIDGKYDNILAEAEYLTSKQGLDIIKDLKELFLAKSLEEYQEKLDNV
jgi:hypothetical protein